MCTNDDETVVWGAESVGVNSVVVVIMERVVRVKNESAQSAEDIQRTTMRTTDSVTDVETVVAVGAPSELVGSFGARLRGSATSLARRRWPCWCL